MTLLELRAMLARTDPRMLREQAGISRATVALAFGVTPNYVAGLETGRWQPVTAAGWRWGRFILGLERRAEVTAEIAAEMGEAA